MLQELHKDIIKIIFFTINDFGGLMIKNRPKGMDKC